jgi:DNA-binding transcriptional MerR regulator
MKDFFSVNQLAKIAGVSVRTLHHYDKIGLLKPHSRTESRYRVYGHEELLRLQQILLYKEMDIPLLQIQEIIDDPSFDLVSALEQHHAALLNKKGRLEILLKTISKTIHQLKNQEKMEYKDLYQGMSPEKAEELKKEASEKWGEDVINDSQERLLSMSKKEWNALQEETEMVNTSLASSMHLPVNDSKVQELIARHYKIMGMHFSITPEIYKSLGQMYADDSRFSSYYEKYRSGLALFLRDAISVYCTR